MTRELKIYNLDGQEFPGWEFRGNKFGKMGVYKDVKGEIAVFLKIYDSEMSFECGSSQTEKLKELKEEGMIHPAFALRFLDKKSVAVVKDWLTRVEAQLVLLEGKENDKPDTTA